VVATKREIEAASAAAARAELKAAKAKLRKQSGDRRRLRADVTGIVGNMRSI
jgi:hypothetical protein